MPSLRRLAPGVLAALLLASCTSPGPPAPVAPIPERLDPLRVDPLTGYPLTVRPDRAEQLADAFRGFAEGRPPEEIDALARSILAADPGFHPAIVLQAQTQVLARRDRAAIELLEPVVAELPDYTAALLTLGQALERIGDLTAALEVFSAAAPASAPAADRVAEIRPRAVEIAGNRLRDAVARGRIEDAETELRWLERWAEDELPVLEGAWQVAAARGDAEAELAIVRRLAATGDAGRPIRERLGELELEVGEVRAGLDQFERLAREHPDDPQIDRQLERAKFLWRLELLPPEVRGVGRKPQLERADFALQLYWLVPEIRYARVDNPPIATDILDHPRREEILRVLNLGLMEVDETLHRFAPAEPVTRHEVLAALLELLATSRDRLACLADVEPGSFAESRSLTCVKAAECRLISEAADCLPAARIAGPESLELFRRALDSLGAVD